MEEEKIANTEQSLSESDESSDASIGKKSFKKAVPNKNISRKSFLDKKTGGSSETDTITEQDKIPEFEKPMQTRKRSNAIAKKDFMEQLLEGHQDSDKETLKSSEYYEQKIENLRNEVQQIHELRALLKEFPDIDKINSKAVKSAGSHNNQTFVNSYIDKWREFCSKYSYIGSWYEGIVLENIDGSKVSALFNTYHEHTLEVLTLNGLVDMKNQSYILPFRAKVYEKLEKYKQDRDMSRFIKQSGVMSSGVDLKDKTIYSFRLGSTIVYGYLDGDNNFCTFKSQDELINNSVTKDKKKKADVDKTYEQEVQKIKAIGELEKRLDSSGLMNKITLSEITSYMNFNEEAFEKQAEEYRKTLALRPAALDAEGEYEGENKGGLKEMVKSVAPSVAGAVPTAALKVLDETKIPVVNWKIGTGDITNAKIFLDNLDKDKPWEDLGEKFRLINDGKTIEVSKADVFKGLCINGGVSLAKCPVEVFQIIKNCTEVPKMLDDLAHAGLIGNGGFFSDEVEKALRLSNFITSDIIVKSASTTVSVVENISKILAGTGKMSATALSNVLSTTGAISGGLSIGTGILNIGEGLYDTIKANRDVHMAEDAENELGKYGEKQTAQNARFIHQSKLTSKEKRANGVLNMVTGAGDVAAGVLSLIPSPATEMAGTVLSLANTALKFIGKFAISKYFKGKKKEQSWADILQFKDVNEYSAFEKRIGSENFRRVLRRRTGVSTRQGYSDALNITDAIDIYTMAKTHSGNPNTKDTSEQITQATLKGVGYSDPSKYKYIKLKDVLSKVGADSDWKGTLKKSITDKKGFFSGRTREEQEDIA